MNGVNIIGPVFGEFGIGEDVRSLAGALLGLDIEINIVEYPKRGNFVNNRYPLRDFCSEEFKYDINIFCIPLFEIFRFVSEYGFSAFVKKYSIGYAPWELEVWPQTFSFMASYLNEIWASSEHTFYAYTKGLDIPVHAIPLIVEVPDKRLKSSLQLEPKIDDSKFNFLYVFDSNSTFARKNPYDVIKSFRKAFAERSDVSLILKTMNYHFENRDLNLHLENSVNIKLINECISRDDLLSLYENCDAYISLHKAEGFGRTIAEAMLLKKPVIVSNYSGNMDFCTSDTAFLVEGELKQLNAHDYPFWFFNRWFSPNIESASKQMLRCFNFPELREKITENAYQLISQSFSTQAVAKKIQCRLIEIHNKL